MSQRNYSKYLESAKCVGFWSQFRVKYVTCWWNNVLRSSLSVIDGPGKWTIQCHIFPSLHAIFSPCSAFWSNRYEKKYPKSHILLLSKIHRISQSFITVCTRQQQSNANCIRHIYWGPLSDFVCSNPLLWFDLFWEQVKSFYTKTWIFHLLSIR